MQMLDTIPEAIEAIRNGEVIIVVDDEDRENEGDFLVAARHATPEVVNFMATHGRGLICAPLVEGRCDDWMPLMVQTNNAAYETPFTVSVDLIGHGCTTGISAQDRSKTIQALINSNTEPQNLGALDTATIGPAKVAFYAGPDTRRLPLILHGSLALNQQA